MLSGKRRAIGLEKTSRWGTNANQVINVFRMLALVGSLVGSLGCSKEKRDELLASAKEKTTQISDATATMKEQVSGVAASASEKAGRTMDQIEAVLPGSGEMALQLDQPMSLSRADLQIVRVDADRPIVLQVFSYPTDKPIVDYPCVMLRALAAPTNASFTDASPWFGKPLDCTVLLQKEADGPIWTTDLGKGVAFTLSPNPDDATMVLATLGTGTLAGSDGSSLSLAGGTITAKLAPVIGGAAAHVDSETP